MMHVGVMPLQCNLALNPRHSIKKLRMRDSNFWEDAKKTNGFNGSAVGWKATFLLTLLNSHLI